MSKSKTKDLEAEMPRYLLTGGAALAIGSTRYAVELAIREGLLEPHALLGDRPLLDVTRLAELRDVIRVKRSQPTIIA